MLAPILDSTCKTALAASRASGGDESAAILGLTFEMDILILGHSESVSKPTVEIHRARRRSGRIKLKPDKRYRALFMDA